MRDENTREQAIRELQRVVQAELQRTANIQGRLQQGLQLWNTPVFTDRITLHVQAGVVVGSDLPTVTLQATDLVSHLRGYKAFLETLARFNTVGRLRNLRLSIGEITDARDDRRVVDRAEALVELVGRLQPLTAYLAEAEANLPPSHPWSERSAVVRQSVLDDVRRIGRGESAQDSQNLTRELDRLKAEYLATYSELHHQLVLGPQGDDRRQRLYNDQRLAALSTLSAIDLLDASDLRTLKDTLTGLPTCREFHEGVIADSPTCPYCHLRPAQRGPAVQADRILDQTDRKLDDILAHWRQALRANLQSETARNSLNAMTPSEIRPIEAFLDRADNDTSIPESFVRVATQALRGIQAVRLQTDDLLGALRAGGLPCTVDELQQRFASFVREKMRGHDARNTRLTLEA